MPSLSSMKSLDPTDTFRGLGEKVQPPAQAPKPEKPLAHNPRVIVKPDGKFETAIPENKAAKMEPCGVQDWKQISGVVKKDRRLFTPEEYLRAWEEYFPRIGLAHRELVYVEHPSPASYSDLLLQFHFKSA